ncbi:MAG: ATP-binding protein, partial [Chitinispirillia bacterium]|nr:ATP-binding protein [Chitinispirillia bacterium]
MPKKIPYGQCNFADIIAFNYAYVDKTRYIEQLENENNRYQFLLRPRRFGKSLFLSMLDNYYSLNNKDTFKVQFGDFYIGKNPTAEWGTYAVMTFDFSGVNTLNHEDFKNSFSSKVQSQVISFLQKYKNIFPNAEVDVNSIKKQSPGIDALNTAYITVRDAGIPLFVLIDEYDHFANNLIAMGKTYKNEIQAGGLVRTFYESLKAETAFSLKRIFITGVSPMMMNDLASGFNMATNLSLQPRYNEMFGFTREEVEWLIGETGINKDLIKVDMETYYNGYTFNERGKDKVYNSQMVLYLFDQIMQLGEQPQEIVDDNLKTDYGRLRRLAANEGCKEKLLKIMTDGGISEDIIGRFSVDDLQNEDYFVSLLFYLGMLTVRGAGNGITRLVIPNYSIKTLYWEYMASYLKNMEDGAIDTRELAEKVQCMAIEGNLMPYMAYFTENVLKRLSNIDLQKFDEKYIKVMMLTNLFISPLYLPVSEDENINGYTDIYLQKHPAKPVVKYEYILEIKYVKTKAPES